MFILVFISLSLQLWCQLIKDIYCHLYETNIDNLYSLQLLSDNDVSLLNNTSNNNDDFLCTNILVGKRKKLLNNIF